MAKRKELEAKIRELQAQLDGSPVEETKDTREDAAAAAEAVIEEVENETSEEVNDPDNDGVKALLDNIEDGSNETPEAPKKKRRRRGRRVKKPFYKEETPEEDDPVPVLEDDPAPEQESTSVESEEDEKVEQILQETEEELKRVARVKPVAQDDYRAEGPRKAYKYWDYEHRFWCLTEDFWAAKQLGGDLWEVIWVWYKDGAVHHLMSKKEIQRYLP